MKEFKLTSLLATTFFVSALPVNATVCPKVELSDIITGTRLSQIKVEEKKETGLTYLWQSVEKHRIPGGIQNVTRIESNPPNAHTNEKLACDYDLTLAQGRSPFHWNDIHLTTITGLAPQISTTDAQEKIYDKYLKDHAASFTDPNTRLTWDVTSFSPEPVEGAQITTVTFLKNGSAHVTPADHGTASLQVSAMLQTSNGTSYRVELKTTYTPQ